MIAMTGADIAAALIGGALVGLAVTLLMICNGRIAGSAAFSEMHCSLQVMTKDGGSPSSPAW